MRLMVLATSQAFTALRANSNDEVPTNLRLLYRFPTRVVIPHRDAEHPELCEPASHRPT